MATFYSPVGVLEYRNAASQPVLEILAEPPRWPGCGLPLRRAYLFIDDNPEMTRRLREWVAVGIILDRLARLAKEAT